MEKYYISYNKGKFYVAFGFIKNAVELGIWYDWNNGPWLQIGLFILRFSLSYRFPNN